VIAQSKIIINGRYRLLDELGRGGMGVVYRAYDRLFDRLVALKQVNFHDPNAMEKNDELRVLLAQEFHMLASLWHPNVITVLDYGFDAERQPFYTMQWVEHHRSIIQAAREVDLPARLDLFRQTFEALEYLHRRGIVHYDLKPSNVLVDLNDQVRLTDFGLAAKLVHYNVFAGTPTYMAPEVLRGEPGTPATDLYTVGVLLHEVFARGLPFLRDGRVDLESILTRPIDLPALIAATGSAPLALVIARLLAKHPDDRYSNARTALTALYRAFNETPPPEAPVIRESHLRPPFIGREQPLAQLTAALDEARAGRGSAWLIGGESGIGKSRLADEVRAIALTRGMQVLIGQGIEDSGAPYQFWRLPLRQLVLQAPPHSFDTSPLTMVIPDIEMLTGEPTHPLHPDDARRQEELTEAICALFAVQPQPVLLVLEDLQWARESMVPLAALIERAASMPVLIIGVYRSDEFSGLPKRLPGTQVISLGRFERDEIARLTAAVLGSAERAEHLVDLLMEQTEGNVFYLIEFMRLLAEMAGGLDAIGDVLPLPEDGWMTEGIRSLLMRRLNRIPPEDFLYLRYAAIIGREIDFEALRAIDPTFDYNRWLSTNVNNGILEMVVGGRARFTHDKMREALLVTIPETRRAELYWLVASAYEVGRADDPEHAFQLALMWREAGDADKVRHYAELALTLAHTPTSAKTVEALYDILLKHVPEHDLAKRLELLTRYADSLHGLSQPFNQIMPHLEAALALAEEFSRQAEGVGDSGVLVRSMQTLARVCSNYDGYVQGIRAIQIALMHAEKLNDVEVQIDLWVRAILLYTRVGEIDQAVMAQQRAAALLPPDSTPELRYKVRRGLPQLLRAQGRTRESYQQLQALLAEFGDIMSGEDRFNIMFNSAVAAWEVKVFDVAEAYARNLITQAAQEQTQYDVANLTNLLGYIQFDKGDHLAAATNFRSALRLAHQLKATSLVLDVLLGIARIRLAAGDVEGAGELIGLALMHPTSNEDVRITAAPILQQLQSSGDRARIDAAIARGGKADLAQVVHDILN
jgi:tetratricopeptide (TPR) repeat protein